MSHKAESIFAISKRNRNFVFFLCVSIGSAECADRYSKPRNTEGLPRCNNKNKGLFWKLLDRFLTINKWFRSGEEWSVYRINRLEAISISMRNLSFILEIGWEFVIEMNIGAPTKQKRIRSNNTWGIYMKGYCSNETELVLVSIQYRRKADIPAFKCLSCKFTIVERNKMADYV